MTPKHQQLVDAILLSMQRRISELVSKCQQPSGKRVADQPIERLRESLLGGHLGAIAHYVEGYAYPYQGDVRVSADFIARCRDSDPLAPQRYRLPPKWRPPGTTFDRQGL